MTTQVEPTQAARISRALNGEFDPAERELENEVQDLIREILTPRNGFGVIGTRKQIQRCIDLSSLNVSLQVAQRAFYGLLVRREVVMRGFLVETHESVYGLPEPVSTS